MKRANKLYCVLAIAGAVTFQQAIHKITSEYKNYIHAKETARLNYVIGEQCSRIDKLSSMTKDISTIPSNVALDARVSELIRQEVASFNSKPSTKHDITEEEIYVIIGKESCGRVCARSKKDAIGLMQVLLSTASRYGIKTEAELFKPENNIHAGVYYYGEMKNMFDGSITLAQAAYNAGPGAVMAYGGVPPFPETMAYVSKMPAGAISRKKQEKHLAQKDKKLAAKFIKAKSAATKTKRDANLDSPHYVEGGETLFAIGRKYNVSPYEIASYNKIPSNYKVREGQLLKIPFKKG